LLQAAACLGFLIAICQWDLTPEQLHASGFSLQFVSGI